MNTNDQSKPGAAAQSRANAAPSPFEPEFPESTIGFAIRFESYAEASAELQSIVEQISKGSPDDLDRLPELMERAHAAFTFCAGRVEAIRAAIRKIEMPSHL